MTAKNKKEKQVRRNWPEISRDVGRLKRKGVDGWIQNEKKSGFIQLQVKNVLRFRGTLSGGEFCDSRSSYWGTGFQLAIN